MSGRGTLDQAMSQRKNKQPLPEPFREISPDYQFLVESPDEETQLEESAGVVSYKPDEWTEPAPDPELAPESAPASEPQPEPATPQLPQQYSMYAMTVDAILPGLHGGIQVVYTALDHTQMSFLCHSIQSIMPVPEMKNPQLRRVSLTEKAWELIAVDEQRTPLTMSEQEWNLRLLHFVLPEVERMRKEWLGLGERSGEFLPNPVEKFFYGVLFQGKTDRASLIEKMRFLTGESPAQVMDDVPLVSQETTSAVVVTYVA